jgi:ATP-binding cassette subfamily C protein
LLKAIAGALERKCAVVLVAHRRSVLQGAHRLLVLDGGRPRMLGPAAEVAGRLAAPQVPAEAAAQ